MNKIILGCLIMLAGFTSNAQTRFFSDIKESEIDTINTRRVVFPKQFRTTKIDHASIREFLNALPKEQHVNRSMAPVLELPMPDGTIKRFRVWESSIQEEALQAKFPDIRTYAGQGIDDPYSTIRFDYNPYDGFHAQILSPTGRVYIDPYARNDMDHYISYLHKDNFRNPFFHCEFVNNEESLRQELNGTALASAVSAGSCRGTELSTYRLAVACTGEYAVAVGGTTAALLHAKIVTSVNRVTGVYESEVSVRLILIANNNLIEFLSAGSDPFTGNNNANTLITESQTQINSLIGSANYDIGHTFSTGAGGLAGLGVVCTNTQKARGVTGSSNPVGDGYDIDYVAHEIGHQFGGNHTFNGSLGSCSGSNRNSSTAYEPGSGTTIQAYAGICSTDNTQPNSDPYFHSVSFDEISTYVSGGGSCKVAINTGNTLPSITAMNNNGANIPINTPFTLSATATDADGDAITYSWEEWDLGAQGAWNAGASSTTAPLFKSRIPKSTGSRTFPDIAVILAGYPANPATTMGGLRGEVLPTVARAMKFRLTVRDNRSGGGGVVTGGSGCQTGYTTGFQINTITGTGPFAVTAPNGGESYAASSSQNITWNTAGSDGASINCQFVKITLSVDGGNTYPVVMTSSTPNDGSDIITIPNNVSTTARIKIEAVGNIFFDISNSNFTITAATANSFDFTFPAQTNIACASATTASVSLGTTVTGVYTTPINLTASGNPAGTTVSFSTNPLTPGSATTVTLNNVNTLSSGSYTVTVTGISGSLTKTRNLVFVVGTGSAPSITTQPSNQSVCAGTNATFSTAVTGTVLSYQWQQSTDGTNFTNISGATAATYTVVNPLISQNGNSFRLNVSGQCNSPVSNIVTLTVASAPSVPVISPASATVCSGSIQSVTANSTSIKTYNFGTQAATNTASTASAGYPAPYTLYYGGQRMQMLIKASELSAAGFVAGSQLSDIQFPVVSRGSNWGGTTTALNNFKVSIGNTSLTTLSTFQTGLTTVVAASNFTPAVGYNNTHTFSSAFTWDGSSNIIIETTFSNNITGAANDLVTQYNSPAGYQSTIVYRADGVTAATAAAATTVNFSYTSRPDFKLNGSVVSAITWSPLTDLYTDAAATTAYTGTTSPTVYIKPSTSGTFNYTATATGTGCNSSSQISITVPTVISAPTGTNGSRCGTGTVSLSATSSGNVIDWYASSTGGTALTTGSNNFTTPSIAATTIYYAEARNASTGCVSGTRTAITATVNTTAPATGTNGSRCGTGSVTLSASSSGNVIDWYAASTGGTALLTASNSFTTPSISSSTLYYAEARNINTGCISATRTAVTATINVTTIPTGTNGSRCGTGIVLISASSSGNVIDWYAASTGGTALLSGSNSYTTPSIAATTTYYAEARNTTTGCISATRTAVTATVNSFPATPIISAGGPTTFCNGGSVTLTSSSAINNVWSTGATTQSIVITTSGSYTLTVNNASGCTATSNPTTVTVNACSATLNLKLFLEGYYTGSSTMNTTLFDLGMNANSTSVDTITVNLWSALGLNNPSPSYSQKIILQKNGTTTVIFPAGVSGNNYYIAVKHRNHLETWSASPVAFTLNTNYDFSTGINKAYGDGVNPAMKNLGGNVYGFYGGDSNNDGTVDGSDMSMVENGAAAFEFGYNANDITGDGATDGADLSLIENNAQLFLFYARP